MPFLRRCRLPAMAFVLALLAHFVWSGLFPDPGAIQQRWATLAELEGRSWVGQYLDSQGYWLGYGYGLSFAFTAVAWRRYREQRVCAARNLSLGGITLSGALAVGGCFVMGCCGSPMAGVYASWLGASFLPIAKPLVAALITLSIAGSYWLMQRKSRRDCGGESASAPNCGIHGEGDSRQA
ncbi:MAG: hypothetical protein JNN01_20040 [Opitutaceae bacterium]|nr:hypothetical protein [Opitutaceae bacterium]